MPNINYSTIYGKYIDLFPLKPKHSEITFNWRNHYRSALLNKGSTSVDEQAAWIAQRPQNEVNFIITLKSGQEVGMISLININLTNSHAESARFLIGEPQAVQGIPAAAEAMKLLLELAFEELKLNRVFGMIASENARMIKWQEFIGMKIEGSLRKHYWIDNKFQDAILLGLLLEDYRKVTINKLKLLTK